MSTTSKRGGGRQQLPRPLSWREISHSSWARLDTSALQDIARVGAALEKFSPDPIFQQPPTQSNPSAVLVALFNSAYGPQVLLTRRAETMTSHSGQIAFPGGRIEPGESPLQAALRETHEEIGVRVTSEAIIGELSAHRTISSSSHIIPYVAMLSAEPTHYERSGEVDRVLSVPLSELVRPDTFAQEHWVFDDREVVIPIFYLDDETIWGATARMLQELIAIVLAR